jgi:branched-subunit amino acid aminotransferase/4-amino-4-deoxychorismate lyase
MLDLEGFVSETNATNLFMVDDGILYTPAADHCLPGITRETVLMLAQEMGIETVQRRISLAEFHSAEEVFTSGTMGGITPVTVIDGRTIGNGSRGVVTEKLQQAYSKYSDKSECSTAIPHFCTAN